jgi:hypothetical protein
MPGPLPLPFVGALKSEMRVEMWIASPARANVRRSCERRKPRGYQEQPFGSATVHNDRKPGTLVRPPNRLFCGKDLQFSLTPSRDLRADSLELYRIGTPTESAMGGKSEHS